MSKVSVIIPVYNAHDYLARCLDSVCNQTLQDIEIICVDDCSTDNSLTILKEYAVQYPQLKIIHLETNGGESKARNTGIQNATGEYLGFVDNDDTVDLDFYEKLYHKAKEDYADIAKAEVHEITYDGQEVYGHLNQLILENESKLYFNYCWWTAIYKRSLITENHLSFLEGCPLGGDVLFLNQAVLAANKVALVSGTFYHYYRREDSGDSKILSLDKIKSVLDIHKRILDNILSSDAVYSDVNAVAYICLWCVEAAFLYAYRNQTLEGMELCIEHAIQFYQLSKKYFPANKTTLLPVILSYLEANDVEGLKKCFFKYNSPSKLLIANLRYLHLQKQNAKNFNDERVSNA